MQSVKMFGILVPLIVVEKKIRKMIRWELRDGLNRLLVAKELGIEEVPVLLCSENELRGGKLSTVVINLIRGRECGNRVLAFIYHLHADEKVSVGDIANALQKSPETIEKYFRAYRRFQEFVLAEKDDEKRGELLRKVDTLCPSIRKFVNCCYRVNNLEKFVQCLEGSLDVETNPITSREMEMVQKLLKIIRQYRLTPEELDEFIQWFKNLKKGR